MTCTRLSGRGFSGIVCTTPDFKPGDQAPEGYLAWHEWAERAAKAGMSGKDIDTIARDIITNEGYGEYFGHGLGHGIGLEVHEEPRVSQINTNALPVGAVVTIEPGIYLPNRFGVRIENDIFLGLETTEVLTVFPTDLIIV